MRLKTKYLLIILIIIGIFLRFYNINWSAPFYFHPDERNIATSVAQLNFPTQMNPHFFAYGSLPIYAIYFTNYLLHLFQTSQVRFEEAIIISRFYSALFSTLLIPLLFYIGKKLKDEKLGFLAAFLATTSVGFIQFAHFGTFEMWLTFFGTLLFWLCLQKANKKNLFLMAIMLGVLMATKVSSIALLPLPLIVLFLQKTKITNVIKSITLFVISSVFIYLASNPFVLLDYTSFIESMKYESSLVLGNLPVFYTGGFYNTTPIIFQFLYIYPFILNSLLTIVFIPAFFYLTYQAIKTKNRSFLLLNSFFLLLFLPQAFLFAKWTRYIVPTLPFVYLIIAIVDFSNRFKKPFVIGHLSLAIFILANMLFAASYFITAFVRPDTRVEAERFAQNSIPKDAKIISEPYDLGLMPFNSFTNIKIVNFYEESESNSVNADYIILPSQRIIRSRLLNPNKFPKSYAFYSKLINGNSGFKKIYETPCDIFCKITYLNNPIFSFEETANVFDRPTIFIFKKI